jgi:hypothetical protein
MERRYSWSMRRSWLAEPLFARLSFDQRRARGAAGCIPECVSLAKVYYAWRPNLPDEADNHVVELAVAGGATAIVTYNIQDFARAELHSRLVSSGPQRWCWRTGDGHLDDSLAR